MRFDKKLLVILSISVITIFGVSYITFANVKNKFPDPGIRNRNYNIAKLEKRAEKEINNYVYTHEHIDLDFANVGENIFVRLYSPSNASFMVYGYIDNNLKEEGIMQKINNEYRFYFNFDYFDINHIRISVNQSSYINSVSAYYIK